MRRAVLAIVSGVLLALAAPAALADDLVTYAIALKDKTFTPAELKVPAGKPFIIRFTNGNAAPAELEAKDLQIEKVAAGNATIVVRVKAQEPEKYLFVDEYQEDVAKGYIIVE
jgi:hypothetical protein